jgi:hypothetical protein
MYECRRFQFDPRVSGVLFSQRSQKNAAARLSL